MGTTLVPTQHAPTSSWAGFMMPTTGGGRRRRAARTVSTCALTNTEDTA
ncbi:hypothetical protein [Kocuria atrinae]|nr:hypothetical protein [Kocuria atrinae]